MSKVALPGRVTSAALYPAAIAPQGIPGVCCYESEHPGFDLQFSRHETVRLTRWFVAFDYVHRGLTLKIGTQNSPVRRRRARRARCIRETPHPARRVSHHL